MRIILKYRILKKNKSIISPEIKKIKDEIVLKLLNCKNVDESERELVHLYYKVDNSQDLHNICAKCYQYNDGDLNWLDTSNITDMSYIFCCTNSIINWDDYEFIAPYHIVVDRYRCNNNIPLHIELWDTSKVTNMQAMFCNWYFNICDISYWDVSNVTDMSYMFKGSKQLNIDLSRWDVHNVIHMELMFYNTQYNFDLSSWNVLNVKYYLLFNARLCGSAYMLDSFMPHFRK